MKKSSTKSKIFERDRKNLPKAIFSLLDGLTYTQAKKALDGAAELLDDVVRVEISRQLNKVPDEPVSQNRN
jgi:hypothetical protein